MARRSSARLRGRNSSTPKRVSLPHDAQPQTPRTAPSKLAALNESDEMPGAFPSSVSPPPRFAQTAAKPRNTDSVNNATPSNSTPIKPAEEEMHPQQHQQSTAKPLEEARWLGFSNMQPQTELPKQNNTLANLQATPTKTPAAAVRPSQVQFAFNREQSLELSPAAKRLMEETRGEAARIREQMVAHGETGDSDMAGRKIATPKSRKGRFSNAHQAEFNKMDSIASHHSVRHVQPQQQHDGPLNISVATPSQKSRQRTALEEISPTKSLKRKQSRADLDEPDRYAPYTNAPTSMVKAVPVGSQLPRPTSTNNLFSPCNSHVAVASPAKRIRPNTAGSTTKQQHQQSPPRHNTTTPPRRPQPHYPDLSALAPPTQASMARNARLEEAESKIPGPALVKSPFKPALKGQVQIDSPKSTTSFLARPPSKATLFERKAIGEPHTTTKTSPLLLRSPTKPTIMKKSPTEDACDNTKSPSKVTPLLARSPLKVSTVREGEPVSIDERMQEDKSSTTPLLHRTPAKLPVSVLNIDGNNGGTPSEGSQNGLFGRFQLLRSSPVKSILRSPQRLYSDDPAKVAAGTHLATPPKFIWGNHQTGTAQKRVDFTSSTKARYERAQSELSSTPSKSRSSQSPLQSSKSPNPSESMSAQYPTLPMEGADVVVTPQKRRETTVPGDFTFKAGHDSIIFRQSPNAPISASKSSPATIRHVSADATLTLAAGTKRKFEDKNNSLGAISSTDIEQNDPAATSDKENEQESERPAKRLKKTTPDGLSAISTSKPIAKPAPTKRPTLGVKPKGAKEKKPKMISQARLDALSQPKRRT